MRTAGLTMNDVWADRILRECGVETCHYEALPAEIDILVETVELRHRGQRDNYRPYLHLSGELRTVTPAEALPYEVSQVTFSPGRGERVDAFYEFDDQQLSVLAGKGYFSSAFAVPEEIIGIEWKLPATVDVLMLAPADVDTDAPVVFTQVHDIAGLEIDLEASGYDLAGYFDDHSRVGISRTEAVVDERGLQARSDAINSLFTEDELTPAADAERGIGAAGHVAGASDGMSADVQQIEAAIADAYAQRRADLERTDGTPEHLYRQRVAPALHTAGEATPATDRVQVPVVELDADLEQAASDHAQGRESEPTFDERRREVARGAADLDVGDRNEPGLEA